MIPVRHRAASLACLALAEFLYSLEVFSALVMLWRVNEYGQWPHSFVGAAALWLKCKSMEYVLPMAASVKTND